jgi:hypothetical protein
MIISNVKSIAFQFSHFCKNYRFSKTVLYIIDRKIHGCLEIPDLFLVLNIISDSFAALTREISCSTLEINLIFPRTHVLFSIYIICIYYDNFEYPATTSFNTVYYTTHYTVEIILFNLNLSE